MRNGAIRGRIERTGRLRAFSLAEILIAFAILAAALVPLFLMQSTAAGEVKASIPGLEATALAGEVAEQLRTLPFGMLPVAQPLVMQVSAQHPPTQTPLLPGTPSFPLAIGTYPLDAQVTITVEPLDPPAVLARLTVTVSVTDPASRTAHEFRRVELIENLTGVPENE